MLSRKLFVVFLTVVIFLPLFMVYGSEEVSNKTAAELFPHNQFKKMLGDKLSPKDFVQSGTDITKDSESWDSLPASFDWRPYGIMTGIRNQGNCGSCWAFAAVGVFEALIKQTDSGDPNLSEQMLVNCVSGNDCDGGYVTDALEYMVNNGIALEKHVPYKAQNGTCNSAVVPTYYLNQYWYKYLGYSSLTVQINNIKDAIYNYGPVALSMTIYSDFYYNYSSGVYIYDGVSADEGGHAIVAVGWVDDASVTNGGYWICKNSWGASWGENGYFRIGYGQADINYYLRYASYAGKENSAPEFDYFVGTYNGREGDTISFAIGVSDDDGDTITFSALNLPENATIDPSTGQFLWTIGYVHAGTYEVTIRATDGIATISQVVTFNIANVKTINK